MSLEELQQVRVRGPAAITKLTPACSMRMHHALPNSTIKVFENSSHMPFYEQPDAYFATLLAFLDQHSG